MCFGMGIFGHVFFIDSDAPYDEESHQSPEKGIESILENEESFVYLGAFSINHRLPLGFDGKYSAVKMLQARNGL